MNLEIYNKSNCSTRVEERLIKIRLSSGQIVLSRTLINHLKLQTGSKLCFGRDKNKKTWYIILCKPNDISAFSIKKNKVGYLLYSKKLSKKIMGDFNNTSLFLVAKEPELIDNQNSHQLIPIKK